MTMQAPQKDVASRLLRFEQQLQAYQKLHGDELAELWRALDECKRDLTDALANDQNNGAAAGTPAHEDTLPQEKNDPDT